MNRIEKLLIAFAFLAAGCAAYGLFTLTWATEVAAARWAEPLLPASYTPAPILAPLLALAMFGLVLALISRVADAMHDKRVKQEAEDPRTANVWRLADRTAMRFPQRAKM
jgi:hypothetical protein